MSVEKNQAEPEWITKIRKQRYQQPSLFTDWYGQFLLITSTPNQTKTIKSEDYTGLTTITVLGFTVHD